MKWRFRAIGELGKIPFIVRVGGLLGKIPSGIETWLAGKSSTQRCFSSKTENRIKLNSEFSVAKVWLPESIVLFVNRGEPIFCCSVIRVVVSVSGGVSYCLMVFLWGMGR